MRELFVKGASSGNRVERNSQLPSVGLALYVKFLLFRAFAHTNNGTQAETQSTVDFSLDV
jgi:hypothetical protein